MAERLLLFPRAVPRAAWGGGILSLSAKVAICPPKAKHAKHLTALLSRYRACGSASGLGEDALVPRRPGISAFLGSLV